MIKYSYYPGCTLRTKAKELDRYARESAKALGFELEEIENWQCCGGVYPLGSDEIASKLSSVRALNEAKEKGQDRPTLSRCSLVLFLLLFWKLINWDEYQVLWLFSRWFQNSPVLSHFQSSSDECVQFRQIRLTRPEKCLFLYEAF